MDSILPRPVAYLTGLLLAAGVAAMLWAVLHKKSDGTAGGDGVAMVVVDAGHGGVDGGTVQHGLLEKDVVLDIALRMKQALLARGVRVLLTRNADVDMSLAERAAVVQSQPGVLFVSVHANRFQNQRVRGVEVYFSPQAQPATLQLEPGDKGRPYRDERSKVLAERILGEIGERLDVPLRGVRPSALYLTRNIPPPAVLVECGYLSNPLDARMLSKAAERQKIAEAIAAACDRYLRETRENRLLGYSPWTGQPLVEEPRVEGPEGEP